MPKVFEKRIYRAGVRILRNKKRLKRIQKRLESVQKKACEKFKRNSSDLVLERRDTFDW